MFCGTRDLLVPGCRLLARRAAEAGWPLTYVEQPGLIHAYPVLPFLPEARVAFRETVEVLVMSVEVLAFDDLDATTAYDVWRLRQQVFVVEQGSPYPDLDGRDREPGTRHLLLRVDGDLVGYARVLDDGDWARIGRVVVAKQARGQGLADLLVRAALDVIGDREIRLDAQTGLVRLVRVVRLRGQRAGVRRRRRHAPADGPSARWLRKAPPAGGAGLLADVSLVQDHRREGVHHGAMPLARMVASVTLALIFEARS